jgi:hypothetical protein
VERGLNKKSSLSICRYYEILIYKWLAWFTTLVVRMCKLTLKRFITKMVFASLCGIALVLSVAGIAKAIPIELTDVWYPTPSEPAAILLLGFGLIGVSGFCRSRFKK